MASKAVARLGKPAAGQVWTFPLIYWLGAESRLRGDIVFEQPGLQSLPLWVFFIFHCGAAPPSIPPSLRLPPSDNSRL